jgi:tRNA(adenine34) deaminase
MQYTSTTHDDEFMRIALKEAEAALERGDRPIGAVIVHQGQVISRASCLSSSVKSKVAHAELNAILEVAPYLHEFGRDCVIYTTCEPCLMCLGAIVMANIRNIVFGMPDNYTESRLAIEAIPYVRSRIHRYTGGVLEDESIALFRKFSPEEAALCLHGPR